MINAETRLEARHALSLIEWRIVPRVRGSEESAEPIVLKGFGPDQHKEHFGADKAPFQLKEEQFEPLSQYLTTQIAWTPEQCDYELVQVVQNFELLESSAPDGELEPAIDGLFTLPEATGKWCVLILSRKIGSFDEHDSSPIFMFPANDWRSMARDIVVPYITQIQSVRYFLCALKIRYMWAFLDNPIVDGLQNGTTIVGESAEMLTAKIVHWTPKD
jgi:hypothetical protein